MLHWNSAWITNLFISRNSELGQVNFYRARKLIDCLTSLNHSKEVAQSLIELTTEIKAAIGCDKVAIGTFGTSQIRIRSITDSAHLEKNSHISKCYAAAMDVALDRDVIVQATREETAAQNPHDPVTQLLEASGNALLVVVPLSTSGRKIGALTLEWQHVQLEEESLKLIDAIRSVLAPAIESRLQSDQNSAQRLGHEIKQVFEKLLGPDHLMLKTVAAICIIPLLLSLLIHIPFRVTAKTVVEGEVQRTATAPFNGFISRSFVKAGDQLQKGQVLLELDTTDLEIEKHKWQGERDQNNEKLQQAIAAQDLAEVQVASAQLKQSQSQLALTIERLARAKIRAPFDGVVISGDQSQQIGAPVETGKKLFEIAPLDRYRVILQVDERDVGSIRQGQQGKLIITGLAGEAMALRISRITPVATAKDGKNYFRVEARLDDTSIHLRPGMEGVGKIETPSRSLFWIVTHKFTDWLRLTLWTWLP